MRNKDLSEWDGTEAQEDFTGKIFGRSVEKNIREALKFFPVLICTGGRQSGKTTMLRQALPEFTYVTLDLPSVSRMAEETPELFFQKYEAPLIKKVNHRLWRRLAKLDSSGIEKEDVKAWISALERSGQITLLQPWSNSEGKRLVRTPKFYFNDSGLLCWLLGVDEKSLVDNIHLGAIWETFVFSQIRKLLQQSTSPYRAFFYRDKDGK